MRKISVLLSVMLLVVLSALSVQGGEISLTGKTDKDPLSYKPGEEMVYTISVLEDGKLVSGKSLLWTRRGDDGQTQNGKAVSDEKTPLTIKTTLSVPGFVHILVQVLDEKGKPLHGDKYQFNGGSGVLLDQIKGYPEPADFDAFWQKQKERLAKVPMKVTANAVPSGNDKVVCQDIRIDCLGKPVSGYFCKPKNAAAKSLPAQVFFHGYGVHSANIHANENALTLNINAHGIANGESATYYENLRQTTLKGYGFSVKENADPVNCYWNGMVLRLLRALEFIKSQPEWDGKNLSVCGGSQGGFQSLVAAGLDSDVTLCTPVVPWFCDVSGSAENKRIGSLFMPPWTPGLGYYDSTNHAKRIKAEVRIDSGLGDYVCPPSGQLVLYNNIKSPKTLKFTQGRTHGFNQMKDATVSTLKSE